MRQLFLRGSRRTRVPWIDHPPVRGHPVRTQQTHHSSLRSLRHTPQNDRQRRHRPQSKLVQKERETIVNPVRTLAPLRPLRQTDTSTARHISNAVNAVRRQAASVMEHRASSVNAATHRTEARLARIMQTKDAAVAQKKKESLEAEHAKRVKIESGGNAVFGLQGIYNPAKHSSWLRHASWSLSSMWGKPRGPISRLILQRQHQ